MRPQFTHSSALTSLVPDAERSWLYNRTSTLSHNKPHGCAETTHETKKEGPARPKVLAFTLQTLYPSVLAGAEWPGS